jgi:protease-4
MHRRLPGSSRAARRRNRGPGLPRRASLAALLVLLLLAAALPGAARAQAVLSSDLASGIPVGLAVPNTVAGASEPDAVSINPAGVGFVGGAAIQYFFEDGQAGSVIGNGLYMALPIGPLVPALALEWMSPAGAARYLKTELALAFAWKQVVSVAVGWNFYSTPGAQLKGLLDVDLGLTVRPVPFLSLGASVLGLEGRVDGQPLPVRFAFGAAGRLLDGALEAAFDAYANDGGAAGAFGFTQGAATLTGSLPFGLVLQAQWLFPLRPGQAPARMAQAVQLAVTWNLPHAGVTVAGRLAGSGLPDGGGMLYGVRASAERYRSRDLLRSVEVVDVAAALRPAGAWEQLLGAPRDRYGALLRRLDEAARDPCVTGMLLEIGELPVGLGRAGELRAAVARVAAHKPVVAFLAAMAGTPAYWVATAATEIWVAPGSVLVVNGLSRQSVFLRDGLARLGVAFEAVAVGAYKNAPDALTRSHASEAQREATASILDSQFTTVVEGIAAGRRMSPARVREWVDVGVLDAAEAQRAGLVDGVAWPDEVEDRARAAAGGARLARERDESRPRAADRWGPQPFVAVIGVEGAIAPGPSRREPFTGGRVAGSDTLVDELRSAAGNPLARAVVLRVESPGGDGFASDLIWRAVAEVRRRGKPVVVSMGDVAASGGYLVAAGADAILAEPTTLTGSIGVFALKPDLSGLLAKLDVNVESDQRGRNARIATFTRAWTPEERALVERQVSAFYSQFVGKVAEGRHLPAARVEEIARGRVWTGAQARDLGLVDQLGGLHDAIALAKERAGLDADARVRRSAPPASFPVSFVPGLAAFEDDRPSPAQVALSRIPEIQAAALLGEMGTVLALPEDWLEGAGGYPAGR